MKFVKKYWELATYCAALFVFSPLQAQIDKVTVTWNRGACLESCVRAIDQQFRRTNLIADVQTNQAAAQAILTWQPLTPFSYQAIEAAMSMVGLSIEHLRIKVKGKISHDDRNVWLVSTGDGTRFLLLGPVIPNLAGYTEVYNLETYILSSSQRQRFLDAEAQNESVTIDGPIFMPERAPPLALIAENTQFEPSSNNSNNGSP